MQPKYIYTFSIAFMIKSPFAPSLSGSATISLNFKLQQVDFTKNKTFGIASITEKTLHFADMLKYFQYECFVSVLTESIFQAAGERTEEPPVYINVYIQL